MTFPIIPASTVSGGYQISRSLRFRSSASAYLSRTMAMQSSRTLSMWVKRGAVSVSGTDYNILFNDGSTGDFFLVIGQASSAYPDKLRFTDASGTALYSAGVLRDPSAWYHIVVSQSSTATSIYINGVLSNSNSRAGVAISSSSMKISHTNTTQSFDGYLAEVNFIDGQALTPSSFGAFDTNGVWQPARYTGSYGTNGFYLNFSDNSGATSTTIGKDSSGNSNNWTPNNISVTSGTTYDSMIDSPTNYADGGNGRGNYPTLSPIDNGGAVLSEANLKQSASAAYNFARTTIGMSAGKWYCEATLTLGTTGGTEIGIVTAAAPSNNDVGATANGWAYNQSNGNKYSNATSVAYGASYGNGDVIGIAFDADNGKLWFSKNGTWQASGDPAAGTNAAYTSLAASTYFFAANGYYSNNAWQWNFGQRPFAYTPPSGFSALNTQNLPTPTIANGAQYMAAVAYPGTGGTQTVTNGGNNNAGTTFQPDFVWIKNRGAAWNNNLYDVIRGTGKALFSDLTDAEATNSIYGYLSAFSASGFSATAGTTSGNLTNQSSSTYVAWQWKAGGTGVSNTSGSITSTVSANTSAGFSVVTYSGNLTAGATIGHGLGVIPSMIIVKDRDTAATEWAVYHTSIGNTGALRLNNTAATDTAIQYWNNTTPSSSVFTVGAGGYTNGSGKKIVAYCFAPVSSFSAFGSFVGNGSSDGPMVFTNFRPRWIMIKRTDAASTVLAWRIYDTSRNPYNAIDLVLGAESSNAEVQTSQTPDALSNGFKLRSAAADINASGGTYIYAAFAENPFKYSRAR